MLNPKIPIIGAVIRMDMHIFDDKRHLQDKIAGRLLH
jgi:hypothetical protein